MPTEAPTPPAGDPKGIIGRDQFEKFVAAVVAAVKAEAKPLPLLLSQPQAIEYLGVSRPTFYRLKSAGKLPKPVQVEGSGLRYRRADLEKYVERLKPVR